MAILTKGQRLGAYVVGDLLGQGGIAEVYRGRHEDLDRDVAIKVLNPTFSADPTFPLRFRREAKVTARLSHPNIITVYDFGDTGSTAYLVMELASGEMTDKTRLLTTLGDLVDALAPVFAAAAYANERGVIHRDIKPDNVLLNQQQLPLLADFGLARIQSESLDADESGLILGTPYYMAPEQIQADDVDARTDVYALGVLVFALVAGRVPYDGSTFTAVASQHLKAPVPSVRAVLGDAPERLDRAIARAMAKRPDDRYPTAAAFYDDLVLAAADAPSLAIGGTRLASAITAPPPDADDASLGQTVIGRRGADRPSPGAVAQGLVRCRACDSQVRAGPAFCTVCGARMPPLDDDAAPSPGPAAGPAPAPAPAAGRRRRRRSSAFTTGQRVALAAAAVVVVAVNAIGLWLNQAGRQAAADKPASGFTTFVFDNLGWFKSGMALAGLALAGLASFDMWLVAIDPRHRRPERYRTLRQYHRLMGTAAALTAFSVGLVTCVGIFGFDLSTTRRAVHTVVGTALLVSLVAKVAVIRKVSRYRRHLDIIGLMAMAFYVLVFLTSAVPWAWHELTTKAASLY